MKIEEAIKQKEFKDEYSKVVVNLFYTSSWLNSLQTQIFKPYEISTQQYNVLRILRGQYPKAASVSLIQDRMLEKMSNASRLVEKLKQKELVIRKECPEDRRQVDVSISKKGLKVLKDLDRILEDFNQRLSTITEKEAKQLNGLLDKLRG